MIVTTVVPDGIVMAADSASSRITMMDLISLSKGDIEKAVVNTFEKTYDHDPKNIINKKITSRSIQKLHAMNGNSIAISSGHQTVTQQGKTVASCVDLFCQSNSFCNPQEAALALLNTIHYIDPTCRAQFHVCGYNLTNSFPEFYFVDVAANNIMPICKDGISGIFFCGSNDFFSSYKNLIDLQLPTYSLQDAIDVTLFSIDLSIKLDRFISREENISPPIDLLVITPSGIEWIQKKKLIGG
jgi:hypothetical protein